MYISRRDFLKVSAVAAASVAMPAALPASMALAEGPAKYRRVNVTNPDLGPHALASYKKAIRVMLKMPPEDPRNWYRIAITHMLDCPHGNWWFLPWHRGFLGWFEEICRELSQDPDFALPYWDWTAEPRVPQVMFDDVLTPTNPAFIENYKIFETKFLGVVKNTDYWKRLFTPKGKFDEDTQYGNLLRRGIRSPDDFWFDVHNDPRWKLFFDLSNARGLTKEKPDFDEKTNKAVSLTTILDALSPEDFIKFGSPKTLSHGLITGFGVLEGQPHNRVHNCVGGDFVVTGPDGKDQETNNGGFMHEFLSPVDPIFFLHHANIDRLWDLWTRKQQMRGLPILPNGYLKDPPTKGTDYYDWSKELFLFFVNSKGKPVNKTKAGDYATIGDFNYDYQPASGEEVLSKQLIGATSKSKLVQSFVGKMDKESLSTTGEVSSTVTIPPELLQGIIETNERLLFAMVTVAMPSSSHMGDYKVIVDGPADVASLKPSSPYYAATLSMFGHHLIQCPVTFTVPLSLPIAAIKKENRLLLNKPLDLKIRIVPETNAQESAGIMARRGMDSRIEVLSITVESQ